MLLHTDVPGGQISVSACYKLTETQVDMVYCYISLSRVLFLISFLFPFSLFFFFFLVFIFLCSKRPMNIGIRLAVSQSLERGEIN